MANQSLQDDDELLRVLEQTMREQLKETSPTNTVSGSDKNDKSDKSHLADKIVEVVT